MIVIKERPYAFDEELANEDTSKLRIVASGETYKEAVENLVVALNNDEVDDLNNELIIEGYDD